MTGSAQGTGPGQGTGSAQGTGPAVGAGPVADSSPATENPVPAKSEKITARTTIRARFNDPSLTACISPQENKPIHNCREIMSYSKIFHLFVNPSLSFSLRGNARFPRRNIKIAYFPQAIPCSRLATGTELYSFFEGFAPFECKAPAFFTSASGCPVSLLARKSGYKWDS